MMSERERTKLQEESIQYLRDILHDSTDATERIMAAQAILDECRADREDHEPQPDDGTVPVKLKTIRLR
jgi:hypothetical protein